MIIQLTGLPGSGKSTLSKHAMNFLSDKDVRVTVIDGDVYRSELCRDLGFSREDRLENIRRLGAAGYEKLHHCDVVIIAAINPFEASRKELVEKYLAKTVWLDCDLTTLMKRDPKGLYRRAMLPEGHPQKLNDFTGISQEYEIPCHPDLIINTARLSETEAAALLVSFIISQRK